MTTYDYYIFSKILAIVVTCLFVVSLIIAIRAESKVREMPLFYSLALYSLALLFAICSLFFDLLFSFI